MVEKSVRKTYKSMDPTNLWTLRCVGAADRERIRIRGANASGSFLQKGYRQELSVDWPETAKCPLIGLLDDLRQLRWYAEFAGEVCDRCELLTAPSSPKDVR